MRDTLKQRIIEVCNKKIESKGTNVGLSFYAFFANKNDDPALLMEAAEWWIVTHQLDHFERAAKIKKTGGSGRLNRLAPASSGPTLMLPIGTRPARV
jgi:Family of unknown function (DUF6500)